jgi:hypothetical protein
MATREIQSPDYAYWLKVRTWTSYETTCLLLEVEPHSLPLRPVWPDEEPLPHPVQEKINEVERLWTILERAQDSGELGKVRHGKEGEIIHPPISWKAWIKWVTRNSIPYTSRLDAAVAELENAVQQQEVDIDRRRETTLLRIIASLLHLLKSKTGLSEADMNREIRDLFGHIHGISKSQMDKDFAEAKRRLSDY